MLNFISGKYRVSHNKNRTLNSLNSTPIQQQMETRTTRTVRHPKTAAFTRTGRRFSTGGAGRWQRHETSCHKDVLLIFTGALQLYLLYPNTMSCCLWRWSCRSCLTLHSGTSPCYSSRQTGAVWTVLEAG